MLVEKVTRAEELQMHRKRDEADTMAVDGKDEWCAHRQPIFAYLLQQTGAPTDAEELTQRVFEKAYTHREQLKAPEAKRTWLRRIAYREFVSWARRKRPQLVASLEEAEWCAALCQEQAHLVGVADSPEEALLSHEQGALLREAVEALPAHEREVVDAFYFQEQGYEQISSEQSISLSAIASRLHKARLRLRDQLTHVLPGVAFTGKGSPLSAWMAPAMIWGVVVLVVLFPFALARGIAHAIQRWMGPERPSAPSLLWLVTPTLLLSYLLGGLFMWKMSASFLAMLCGVLLLVESLLMQLRANIKGSRKAGGLVLLLSLCSLGVCLGMEQASAPTGGRLLFDCLLICGAIASFCVMRGLSFAIHSWTNALALGASNDEVRSEPGAAREVEWGAALGLIGLGLLIGGGLLTWIWLDTGSFKILYVWHNLLPVLVVLCGLYLAIEGLFNGLLHLTQEVRVLPFPFALQALLGALLMVGVTVLV